MCPAIDPGSFTQLLTFLVQASTLDASGEAVSYVAGNPPLTAWGSVKHVKGTDKIAAGQEVAQDLVTIKTWWQPQILTTMRVQSPTGSIYIIQAVENVDELNIYAVLTCLGVGVNA
jgi:SPP1 family predicted phage head-tail adaptor